MAKLRFSYARHKNDKVVLSAASGDINDDIQLFFNFMLAISYHPSTVIHGLEAFLEEHASSSLIDRPTQEWPSPSYEDPGE